MHCRLPKRCTADVKKSLQFVNLFTADKKNTADSKIPTAVYQPMHCRLLKRCTADVKKSLQFVNPFTADFLILQTVEAKLQDSNVYPTT